MAYVATLCASSRSYQPLITLSQRYMFIIKQPSTAIQLTPPPASGDKSSDVEQVSKLAHRWYRHQLHVPEPGELSGNTPCLYSRILPSAAFILLVIFLSPFSRIDLNGFSS